MVNRHDDTPEINDYTYYVFEEIEKHGLQFAIPKHWRPLYRAFLALRKQQSQVNNGSDTTRYSDDFGYKGTKTTEEDPKAD